MSNPTAGTGSGGDRCTEAVGAMIAATYKIGSKAQAGDPVESIMYAFTEMLNNGSDSSAPENASWIDNWISQNTNGQITLSDTVWPGFEAVVNCVDRGHIAVGGFDDYVNLRLADGSNPYQWNDPHGLGHVLLVVGYDTDRQTVVVHDPLRADPDGQPADYSWASFQAAGFHDLIEVNGPALPGGGKPLGVPAGWTDDGASLTAPNGVKVAGGFRAFIILQGWNADDWPLEPEHAQPQMEIGNPAIGPGVQQAFRESVLCYSHGFNNDQVYLMWSGQEVLAMRRALAAEQQQVAQLQAQVQQLQAGEHLDVAGIKADVAQLDATLAPLATQLTSAQAAEQTVKDLEKKLGS